MNLNIEHYIHKAKWISDDLCDEVRTQLDTENTWKPFPRDVVNAYEQKRPNDGIVGSTLSIDWEDFMNNPDVPKQATNYSLCHLEDKEAMKKLRRSIQDGLDNYVHEYLKDIPWYDYYRDFTDPKFMKYGEGHDMQEHCDHVRYVFDGKRKGIPTVSIVGSLTGDSEGGYVRFWGNKDYYVGKGECMYFPSNFLYPHKVTEVTKGLRYSFVSWVW
tara:strand:- start:3818 stop:4462 length:645 start_codon:yes stop_codon:yes gene_type:complete